jgi:RNA polymerase sigma factor (sigma-70 family)
MKLSVMMVRDLDAAQDVLQNLAVSFYAKRETLEDIGDPQAYFFICLRHAILNHIRDSARALPTDPEELKQMRGNPACRNAFDFIEWEDVIRRHAKGYPEEIIRAFIDHYMNDYPLEQLASDLNMTPNALSQQFRRMRQRIAKNSPKMALYMFLWTMRLR